ncbi:unnamed protein product [Owenia fusiformis]|uniref:Uncharacterized protein n=1 Tax=Owenia fusiformis TaxID=6347 RepID=A0A8J1T6V9_OWEFU|nr:unnamed protein product [Owenia fusiformis]
MIPHQLETSEKSAGIMSFLSSRTTVQAPISDVYGTDTTLNTSGTAFGATSIGVINSSYPSGGLSADDIHNYLHADELTKVNLYDDVTQSILIAAFTTLILFGAAGNGLVTLVVIRNPHMRTPRNIFIINLAISDLTLCLLTQPLNMFKMLRKDWPLGDFMCKMVPMFQGTNVFVSTISITAIALDRFQVIVYPTKESMKKVGAVVALISIWIISLMMSSPLLIFNYTQPFPLKEFYAFTICFENHDYKEARSAYSIASMIFQYVLPIVIVSVAHARICNKLRYRIINQRTNTTSAPISVYQKRKGAQDRRRKRRTNILLVMIGVIFAFSWMPLNTLNIIVDNDNTGDIIGSFGNPKLFFAISHLLVLFSACTNPVLYGWLNDNFKQEFLKVLCLPCCQRIAQSNHPQARNGRRRSSAYLATGAVPTITFTKATTTNNGNGTTTVVSSKCSGSSDERLIEEGSPIMLDSNSNRKRDGLDML